MARRTVVTLCAGSSGNHVLAADLGRRPEIELRLVTSDPAAFGPRIECEETLVLSDSIPLTYVTVIIQSHYVYVIIPRIKFQVSRRILNHIG